MPGADSGDSSDGSAEGSSSGSKDGGEDGSPEGSETASGEGNPGGASGTGEDEDIPVWEPEPSFGDDSEDEQQASAGSVGSYEEVDLEELEKTLDEAMGTFDEEILREQENARNKTGNNGSGTGNVEVLAGVGEFETYGGQGGGGSAPGPTSGSGSGPVAGAGGTMVDDVPPPSPDDDIVARQIREAAINETDPEQRAILWEEYERYKSGL